MPSSPKFFHARPSSSSSSTRRLTILIFSCLLIGLAGFLFGLSVILSPSSGYKCRNHGEARSVRVVWERGSDASGIGNDRVSNEGQKRYKVMGFVGIQTGFGSVGRRRSLRQTWMPSDRQGLQSPCKMIWKAKVPSKVQIFAWAVAHRKISTNEVVQKRNPGIFISPQWCVLCRVDSETIDHLFLHCPLAMALWQRLFKSLDMCWVAPKSSSAMLDIQFRLFGSSKRAMVLWRCVVMAIFWVLWLERNARIFEDKCDSFVGLWDRVCFLTSFWASVSREFRGVPLFIILNNWVEVCE